MTTFRLLQQTNRSSRFAQVTVEVTASSEPRVEVTATGLTGHRREAELGAWWALRSFPAAAKVTVTGVAVAAADTGVGDVYEATARAVWQALHGGRKAPSVGLTDPEIVAAWLTSMIGRRLDIVTEARHWYQGRRKSDAESLLHAWLVFENAVPVRLHGHGDQLLLAKEDPYLSYDMDEQGQVRVGPAQHPDVLSEFIGARLTDGATILGHDGDTVCAGLLLRFGNDDLIVGMLGDEWILAIGSMPAAANRCWAVQPMVGGG